MKVLKFGGTSVGSVESLLNVKKIVEGIPGNAIVVVSALGGLTDKLISTAEKAASGDNSWMDDLQSIRDRHEIIINEVVPSEKKDKVREEAEQLLNALQRNYEGVSLLNSLPSSTLDLIVSFGERISSIIVAAMIIGGKRYYSPDFIKTEKWYGKNIANIKLTDSLIKDIFSGIGPEEKAVVPGFISTDSKSGEITNLGRGGSDYTGALIAAAIDADVLEIWTDVDGFMTADPRIVKDALIINHLTFTESMELCTFGAKVIYPPTIYPVFHKNIPIKILNTFNPAAPGTLVTDHPHPDDFDVKGVSSLKGVTLLSIDIKNPFRGPDIAQRALNALSKNGVAIIPLSDNETFSKLNIGVSESDSRNSTEILKKEFAPELSKGHIGQPVMQKNMAAIALVGKDMKKRGRLGARIGHSLLREGIEVSAYSDTSDTTLLYIINQEKIPEALPLIHSLVF